MDNQNPQVIYTPQAGKSLKKSWFNPKIFIYVLILVILTEIVWAVITMLAPVAVKTDSQSSPAPAVGASILLSSSLKSYKQGDGFLVDVKLHTGGSKTIGTDIVLKYDPRYLEASQAAFTKGVIYSDYPAVKVDSTKGIITASGIDDTREGNFNGFGGFGTVWFKTKALGRTNIELIFEKDSYADSNIVEFQTNRDVLEKVSNLTINII